MTQLLICTSSRIAMAGLVRNGVVIQSVTLDESRRHARDLADAVRRMLAAEALAPKDITAVVVSQGPGSFTGLRVGLASAKAFAYAVGCPLIAVPTFAAIIETVPPSVGEIDVASDALQGLVYVQRYRFEESWKPVTELKIVAAVNYAFTPVVAGPWGQAYPAATLESLWLASRKYPPLSREEMFAVEPLYLRGSSAEEKRKASQPSC